MRALPGGPLRRAAAFLEGEGGTREGRYPELWIGKSLYAPVFAIEAARESALGLYRDTFGGSP